MLNKLTLAMAAMGGVLASTGQAQAAVVVRDIAIRNAGFEERAIEDGSYLEDSVEGWVVRGALAAFTGTANLTAAQSPTVPEGSNVAFLNSFNRGNGNVSGGFYQDLAETVVAGTQYDLSVQLGRRADNADYGPIRVGRYTVQLLSGGTLLAEGSYSDDELAPGQFRALNLTYVAAADLADPLRINFSSIYDPDQNGAIRQVLLDDVRLTASNEVAGAVPEPATWATMIGGLGMVGAAARRRRRNVAIA